MKGAVLYIHGRGGSAGESAHFVPLFPRRTVIGLEYSGTTPWEAGEEIRECAGSLCGEGQKIILIANSIGACFALHAGISDLVERAYFISPVADMERIILDMMKTGDISETSLREKGEITTPFGETISYEYLRFAREHPVKWNAPAFVLFGENDFLVPKETKKSFADRIGARLTVMPEGGHWFHTEEQMSFLDNWIKTAEKGLEL